MAKNVMTGSYVYNDEIVNFEFYTDLSVSEKLTFINSVVDIVVDEGNYNSIIKDLMFDYMVVEIFTDIDTSFLKTTNGTDIDLLEDFLLETNIVDVVKANAFPALFYELDDAINKSIEYKTGIHRNSLEDALAGLVNILEKKIDDIDMGSIDLNKMSKMAELFAGRSNEFTPENVVKAYLQTDIHKKNLEEIAESKLSKNEIKIDEDLGEAIRTVVEDEVVDGVIDSVIDSADKE